MDALETGYREAGETVFEIANRELRASRAEAMAEESANASAGRREPERWHRDYAERRRDAAAVAIQSSLRMQELPH